MRLPLAHRHSSRNSWRSDMQERSTVGRSSKPKTLYCGRCIATQIRRRVLKMIQRLFAFALLMIWCPNAVTGQTNSSEPALAGQGGDAQSSCCSPSASRARRFVLAEDAISNHSGAKSRSSSTSLSGMLWILARLNWFRVTRSRCPPRLTAMRIPGRSKRASHARGPLVDAIAEALNASIA